MNTHLAVPPNVDRNRPLWRLKASESGVPHLSDLPSKDAGVGDSTLLHAVLCVGNRRQALHVTAPAVRATPRPSGAGAPPQALANLAKLDLLDECPSNCVEDRNRIFETTLKLNATHRKKSVYE
jgi:hypothetical protein